MEAIKPGLHSILQPAPLEKCTFNFGCNTYIKRDDLIHPEVSGNKSRKLKYLVQSFIQQGKKGIITFGGAFSNHIYATAAYGNMLDLGCVGIIRGEDDIRNPTLRFARAQNMQLYFVSRDEYKLKDRSTKIVSILSHYPDYGIIPEGGDHILAMDGVAEILDEIENLQVIPDYLALSCGTGTTAAGILKSIIERRWATKVIVIPALNNQHLIKEILIKANAHDHVDKLIYLPGYAGRGYGKADLALIQFMHHFYESTHIPLDPIYTGKLFYGLYQLAEQGYFRPQETLIILHTGGLQGIAGYNYILQKKNRDPQLLIRYAY